MLNDIFSGIFDSSLASVISVSDFLLCTGSALAAGLIIALCYMYKSRYTRSYVVTLAALPAVVCVVIMMVNGNVGTGVAVAGAFSLVRFRSAPGTAREITAIFLGMAAGLMMGMGYIGYGFLFTLIVEAVLMFYTAIDFGANKGVKEKTLMITMPENINGNDVFDDILARYTSAYELVSVKTANLGSMYKFTYDITLKQNGTEQEMINELRCRNGNLEIAVSRQEMTNNEL